MLADHVVEHLAAQLLVVEHLRAVGRTQALAQFRTGALEALVKVALGDLEAVHRRRNRLGVHSHVGLNAPQGERDADKPDDQPGDPSLGPLSDGLKHGLNPLLIWVESVRQK